MADTAHTEFWRDLKPITRVFQTHAMPEAYVENAPIEDERFYAPLSETVGSRPLTTSRSCSADRRNSGAAGRLRF
jgi:2,4'-dihydroxyacetophenone dioxygenase